MKRGSAAGAARQLGLEFPVEKARGGRRPGAGRKPRPENAQRGLVKHRVRPEHHARHPVHVTLRVARGLPSFRSEKIRGLVERVIDRARTDEFQVVHFSIQRDHLHLMIEAEDKEKLSSGVRRVVIALARRFNTEIRRRATGKVWGDRYHRRDLATPREVKSTLSYLFTNAAKHGEPGQSRFVLDRFSSALGFDRWIAVLPEDVSVGRRVPWRPPRARTWLLGTGWWKVHGPLALGDAARGARGAGA